MPIELQPNFAILVISLNCDFLEKFSNFSPQVITGNTAKFCDFADITKFNF